MKEHWFDHPYEAQQELVDHCSQVLLEACQTKGHATLVVSGGRSPVPLFEALAQKPLPWSKITITLADERWVPADHDQSNERLVRDKLIRSHPAHFVSLISDDRTAVDGLTEVAQRLKRLSEPYDLVLLGMGGDGHFASLFPGDAASGEGLNEESQQYCVASRAPVAPRERISQTMVRLCRTHHLILAIQGEEKQQVYNKAKQATHTGQDTGLPVQKLLEYAEEHLEVYWSPG